MMSFQMMKNSKLKLNNNNNNNNREIELFNK